MRSVSVNTAWIQCSNTRSLCIITPFNFSAPANSRLARHPPFTLDDSKFSGFPKNLAERIGIYRDARRNWRLPLATRPEAQHALSECAAGF
jgi:hypothetical protein